MLFFYPPRILFLHPTIMPENNKNIPFFFIIGRPRSGTTLLQSLFDAHPDVVIPPESLVIMRLFNKYGHHKKLKLPDPEIFVKELQTINKFEAWPIDTNKLISDMKNFNGDFHSLIKTVYSCYKTPFLKEPVKIFGDKNPHHSLNLKKIFKIFPEAKIIYIIRDYRDHILSVKRVRLLFESTTISAYRWKRSLISISKLKKKFADSFFTLRYEDFVENPNTEMQKMCEFLHIDFRPAVFDFYKKDFVLPSKLSLETFNLFHSALLKPINNSAVGKWREFLPLKDVQIADYICGSKGTEYGYIAESKGQVIKILIHIIPIILYINLQGIAGNIVECLPYWIKIKIRSRKMFLTNIYIKNFRPEKYKRLTGK